MHLIMCLIPQRSKSPWSKRCSGELIVLAHRNGAALGPQGRICWENLGRNLDLPLSQQCGVFLRAIVPLAYGDLMG